MSNPKKYDTFKEDYDETGRPIPSVRLKSEQDEEKERKKAQKDPEAAEA